MTGLALCKMRKQEHEQGYMNCYLRLHRVLSTNAFSCFNNRNLKKKVWRKDVESREQSRVGRPSLVNLDSQPPLKHSFRGSSSSRGCSLIRTSYRRYIRCHPPIDRQILIKHSTKTGQVQVSHYFIRMVQ